MGSYSGASPLPVLNVCEERLLSEAETQGIDSGFLYNAVLGDSTAGGTCSANGASTESCYVFIESTGDYLYQSNSLVEWEMSAVFIGGPVNVDPGALEKISCSVDSFVAQTDDSWISDSFRVRGLINVLRKHRNRVAKDNLETVESVIGKLLPTVRESLRRLGNLHESLAEDISEGSPKPQRRKQKRTITSHEEVSLDPGDLMKFLDVAILYMESFLFPGVSSKLFVDEINELLIAGVKLHSRTTLHSVFSNRNAAYRASFVSKLKEILQLFHLSMSLHQYTESQIHQLISTCMEALRVKDPEYDLWLIATDLLVSVFRRFEGYESSILTGLINCVKQLDSSSKVFKKFRILTADGHELIYLSATFLKIFQAICLPIGPDAKSTADKLRGVSARSAMLQSCCLRVADQLMYACIQQEFRDGRTVCRFMVEDFCKAARSPICPAAPVLVASIVVLLSKALLGEFKQSSKKKFDMGAKEFCMLLLGEIGSFLFTDEAISQSYPIIIPGVSQTVTDYRRSVVQGSECICKQKVRLSGFVECRRCQRRFHAECVSTDNEKPAFDWQCFHCRFEAIGYEVFKFIATLHKPIQGVDVDSTSFSREAFMRSNAFTVLSYILLAYASRFKSRLSPVLLFGPQEYRSRLQQDAYQRVALKGSPLNPSVCMPADHPVFPISTLLSRIISSAFELSQHHGSVGVSNVFLSGDWLQLLDDYADSAPLITEQISLSLWKQLICADMARSRLLITRCVGIVLTGKMSDGIRRAGTVALSDMLYANPSLVESSAVVNFIKDALMDRAPKVRERALAMLDRLFKKQSCLGDESDLNALSTVEQIPFVPPESNPFRTGNCLSSSSISHFRDCYFIDVFCSMTADKSPLVRAQAVKILRQLCMDNPDSDSTRVAAAKLLERLASPIETTTIRQLVLDTFSKLWLSSDLVPSPKMVLIMINIINVASTLLEEEDSLLNMVIQNAVKQRCVTKAVVFNAVDMWTNCCLEFFLTKGSDDNVDVLTALHAVRVLGTVRPQVLAKYLKHFRHHLKGDPTKERSKGACCEICEILALAAPFVGTSPSVVRMFQSIQVDLVSLIGQNTHVTRCAIGCLCMCVKHVTFEYAEYIEPLLVDALKRLLLVTQDSFIVSSDDLLARCSVDIQRMGFQLACVCEKLDLSSFLVNDKNDFFSSKSTPDCSGRSDFLLTNTVKDNHAVISSISVSSLLSLVPDMKLEEIGDFDITRLICDTFCNIFANASFHKTRTFLLPTIAIFLSNNRRFVKSRRIQDLFATSLSSVDPGMRRNACHAILRLLKTFEVDAVREFQKEPSSLVEECQYEGAASSFLLPAQSDVVQSVPHSTAMECSQPLALHLSLLLKILLEVDGSADTTCNDETQHYALQVISQLYRQGLINPSDIVAPIFSLSFSAEPVFRCSASLLLNSIVGSDPRYLINNLIGCFQQSFIFLCRRYSNNVRLFRQISTELVEPFTRLYADRCRSKKTVREKVIRTLCGQLECVGETEVFSGVLSALERITPPSVGSIMRSLSAEFDASSILQSQFHWAKEDYREAFVDNVSLLDSEYYPVLYLQFVSTILSHLAYVYESEVLLLVYELNKFISLHMLTMTSLTQAESTTPAASCSQSAFAPADISVLASCCSCLTAIHLKNSLKARYKVSDERCQVFDPQDGTSKNEKPRYSSSIDEDNGKHLAFPLHAFTNSVLPLLAKRKEPQKILLYSSAIIGNEDSKDVSTSHLEQTSHERGKKKRRIAESRCALRKQAVQLSEDEAVIETIEL